jgi:hypothetical protein
MFTCERCGVNSTDGFIMPDGTRFCTPCAMLRDNADQNSLSAVAQARTVQEKIDAWRNCNGIQTLPKSNDSGEKTMAEKAKLVADFISAENVPPNERSEFALGLAVALLLQLSTIAFGSADIAPHSSQLPARCLVRHVRQLRQWH